MKNTTGAVLIPLIVILQENIRSQIIRLECFIEKMSNDHMGKKNSVLARRGCSLILVVVSRGIVDQASILVIFDLVDGVTGGIDQFIVVIQFV